MSGGSRSGGGVLLGQSRASLAAGLAAPAAAPWDIAAAPMPPMNRGFEAGGGAAVPPHLRSGGALAATATSPQGTVTNVNPMRLTAAAPSAALLMSQRRAQILLMGRQ